MVEAEPPQPEVAGTTAEEVPEAPPTLPLRPGQKKYAPIIPPTPETMMQVCAGYRIHSCHRRSHVGAAAMLRPADWEHSITQSDVALLDELVHGRRKSS